MRKRTGHLGMSEEGRARRGASIGGSDARIIMSGNEEAIQQLWAEKRGEATRASFEDVLLVQMGNVLEPLIIDWFEKKTGLAVTKEQEFCMFPEWERATCTLDGRVEERDAIFEAKFMMPFGWSMEAALEKYYSQLQHNMMVTGRDLCWIAVMNGAAGFAYLEIESDPLYQMRMLEAEQSFWSCVESGRRPGAVQVEAEIVVPTRVVDMTGSNLWADHAATLKETREAVKRNTAAEKEIKKLVPPDVLEASGYGVTIKRAKNGSMRITIGKEKAA